MMGSQKRGAGSREVEVGTGKDAEKPWTRVQTGPVLENVKIPENGILR